MRIKKKVQIQVKDVLSFFRYKSANTKGRIIYKNRRKDVCAYVCMYKEYLYIKKKVFLLSSLLFFSKRCIFCRLGRSAKKCFSKKRKGSDKKVYIKKGFFLKVKKETKSVIRIQAI
jgi:hypothetical protein